VSSMNFLDNDPTFFLVRIERWPNQDFEPGCNFNPKKYDDTGVYTGEQAMINDDVYKPIASITMHQNYFSRETHYTFQCRRNSYSDGVQWYELEDGKCPKQIQNSGRGLIYLFMLDEG
jgi:hypothetical protein